MTSVYFCLYIYCERWGRVWFVRDKRQPMREVFTHNSLLSSCEIVNCRWQMIDSALEMKPDNTKKTSLSSSERDLRVEPCSRDSPCRPTLKSSLHLYRFQLFLRFIHVRSCHCNHLLRTDGSIHRFFHLQQGNPRLEYSETFTNSAHTSSRRLSQDRFHSSQYLR